MNFLTPLRREEQLHCRRVSAISAFLAEASGLSSPETNVVMQSALFHDVGKAALPPDLLYHSKPLAASEQALILSHTTIGERMLAGMESVMNTAAIVAHQHHEHLDGSGYLGLCDHEIHPHAKLVAVANTFDSLTFRKDAWDPEQVRTELERRSGSQLDRQIVSLLLSNLHQIEDICHQVNTHSYENTHL